MSDPIELPSQMYAGEPAAALPDALRRLQGGGATGMSGSMEPRIARLEATLEHVQGDVAALKTDMRDVRDRLGLLAPMRDDVATLKTEVGSLRASTADVRERLARLEERVSHLPTKDQFYRTIWFAGAAIVSAMGAFVTYAPRLQAALGIAR